MHAMTPEGVAKGLGGLDGNEVLAKIEASPNPELARAIRGSFQPGNEQGNGWRLEALVRIEGKGALDVIRAVLEDTVEVGGIYSNLRNTALDLIVANFLGEPSLEASVRKAIELDEYMQVDRLFEVMRPYDPARAAELLLPAAREGVPAAIVALANVPALRSTMIEILQTALGGDNAGYLVPQLGALATEPDVAAVLAPHADTLPAVAKLTLASADVARLRVLAEKLADKKESWYDVAIGAVARLPPAEAFDRASTVFTMKDHAKPAGRFRASSVVDRMTSFTKPLDARWLPFVVDCLDDEEHAEFRGILVRALGKLGADAAKAIIDAPQNDKDKHVLSALPDALGDIGAAGGVRELVQAAQKKAKGKRKAALTRALTELG